jgi:hypothetical protein
MNATYRSSAPPPGSLWFLRDAIPLAIMENFDIGRIDSCDSIALKEKLFQLGGVAAWADAVQRSRLALDDLLAVRMADVLRRNAVTPYSIADTGTYQRRGVLDILHQGEFVGAWSFDVVARWKIRQRQGRRLLLSLATGVQHNGQMVIAPPPVEGWVHLGR